MIYKYKKIAWLLLFLGLGYVVYSFWKKRKSRKAAKDEVLNKEGVDASLLERSQAAIRSMAYQN